MLKKIAGLCMIVCLLSLTNICKAQDITVVYEWDTNPTPPLDGVRLFVDNELICEVPDTGEIKCSYDQISYGPHVYTMRGFQGELLTKVSTGFGYDKDLPVPFIQKIVIINIM